MYMIHVCLHIVHGPTRIILTDIWFLKWFSSFQALCVASNIKGIKKFVYFSNKKEKASLSPVMSRALETVSLMTYSSYHTYINTNVKFISLTWAAKSTLIFEKLRVLKSTCGPWIHQHYHKFLWYSWCLKILIHVRLKFN